MINSVEIITKVKNIFDQLAKHDVTIVDFADKINISKQTLHYWKKGGRVTDMLRLNIAHEAAVKLDFPDVEA